MISVKSVTTAAFLSMLLANCAHVDAPADIAGAQQAWEDAFNAQDGERTADLYTENARIYPPNRPTVEGRDSIVEFWQAVWDGGAHSLNLELAEAQVAGDTAVEVGTWEVKHPKSDGGEDALLSGRTLVVWRRGDDGVWRMSNDMWNDNPR